MTELIYKPTVEVVAETKLNDIAIQHWAALNGYSEALTDTINPTPLTNIFQRTDLITDDESEAQLLPEFAGRFCYRAFEKGRSTSEYLKNIVEMSHGSVLEASSFSFAIQGVSRSLSMELIRHRAGTAISQESQRYVDAKDINFVVPPLLDYVAKNTGKTYLINAFEEDCVQALENYLKFQEDFVQKENEDTYIKTKTSLKKRANEAARALLPNAAETRFVWTANLRTLRHFCELRGGEGADLEIRRLAVEITKIMKIKAPMVFFDFEIIEGDYGVDFVKCSHHKV